MEGIYLATYIWVDADGNSRSKSKVMNKPVKTVDDLSEWNFDGSSTKQAEGKFSDVFLHPKRIYKDPFRTDGSIYVLCECWDDEQTPNSYNTRIGLTRVCEQFKHLEPLVGIEQEYIIFSKTTNLPYGWKGYNEPGSGNQGPYHCGAGGNYAFGRFLAEKHFKMCIESGVHVFGMNGESMPAQWEFQIGTTDPLTAADDLIIGRYILSRLTEESNTYISFHPKPYLGNWSGSGGHINFSTKAMRKEGGIKKIEEAMELLKDNHTEFIKVYGPFNELRLTGNFETPAKDVFTWGVGDRNASVRIPKLVNEEGKGYFEDRRPGSNLDPYLSLDLMIRVISKLKD